MSAVVTGEGVVLDLRLARLPTRALAFGIDAVVLLVLALAGTFVLGAATAAADPALAATLGIVLLVGVLVGVPVTVETLTRGRSLGKLALGLRVVRDDGGPVRFRHSLARGLAGLFVDFWFTLGVGAVLTSILSKDGKRLGDLLAGTVVVKEQTGATVLPPPPMPAGLEWWARTLELSRLPDDLALSVRTFLTRSAMLDPVTREALARELATAVAASVSPAAPAGTPAWAYLAAVLAERRRRSEASLRAYLRAADDWAVVSTASRASPASGGRALRSVRRTDAAPAPGPVASGEPGPAPAGTLPPPR